MNIKNNSNDQSKFINVIGVWLKTKLDTLDLYTYQQIGNYTEALEYIPVRHSIDEWVFRTYGPILITDVKPELLKRIRERKEKMLRERLKVTDKQHMTNLILDRKIGVWIEERLDMKVNNTFKQTSKQLFQRFLHIYDLKIIPIMPFNLQNSVNQSHEMAIKQFHHEMN